MQTLKRVVVINGNISIAGKPVPQKLQVNAYKNTEQEPAPTQTQLPSFVGVQVEPMRTTPD